jgi:alkylation response protein AidB-like acyl-CoA dehydrogenase
VTVIETNHLEATAAFRDEFRSWLAAHLPADWSERAGTEEEELVEWDRWWLRELHAGGYLVPHWPARWGGRGASLAEEIALYEVLGEAGAPWPVTFYCALSHASHTITQVGTEHQLAHIPRIVAGEEVWCQAFSEPDAGSDLASLRTVAERDGDHYVVNGQKTWSSTAPFADWAILLARTGRDGPKRKGISYFLLDMRAPGVEVRPIRQMSGKANLGEIFLDDVRIPVVDRLGAEGDGWRIAQITLSSERGPGFVRFVTSLESSLRDLLRAVEAAGYPGGILPAELEDLPDAVGQLIAEVRVVQGILHRTLAKIVRTGQPGPEASVIKVMFSETLDRLTDLAVRTMGLEAQLQAGPSRVAFDEGPWLLRHFATFGTLIGAGTNEIQRNLISERVLGMPRERRREDP